MGEALRRRSSALVGWLADRRIPRMLRRPLYGTFSRLTGADASEAELALEGYGSLGAFFVRRLKRGAREIDAPPGTLVSPADGTLAGLERLHGGSALQAKGRSYPLAELLALEGPPGDAGGAELEGGWAWTIYLGPRDYHRVHAPCDMRLIGVRWVPGDRRSVAPEVLSRHDRILSTNERAILSFQSDGARAFLVMVGALNVGRIRVVGVEPGGSPPPDRPVDLARGAELARFELGSTVVLLLPRGRMEPLPGLEIGATLRMGQALGKIPG